MAKIKETKAEVQEIVKEPVKPKQKINPDALVERLEGFQRLLTNYSYFKIKAQKYPKQHSETKQDFLNKVNTELNNLSELEVE